MPLQVDYKFLAGLCARRGNDYYDIVEAADRCARAYRLTPAQTLRLRRVAKQQAEIVVARDRSLQALADVLAKQSRAK